MSKVEIIPEVPKPSIFVGELLGDFARSTIAFAAKKQDNLLFPKVLVYYDTNKHQVHWVNISGNIIVRDNQIFNSLYEAIKYILSEGYKVYSYDTIKEMLNDLL